MSARGSTCQIFIGGLVPIKLDVAPVAAFGNVYTLTRDVKQGSHRGHYHRQRQRPYLSCQFETAPQSYPTCVVMRSSSLCAHTKKFRDPQSSDDHRLSNLSPFEARDLRWIAMTDGGFCSLAPPSCSLCRKQMRKYHVDEGCSRAGGARMDRYRPIGTRSARFFCSPLWIACGRPHQLKWQAF